ncbi:ABC transporter type 1, transmembrane domain-containing protein [Mycena floridula]|nr:ABC transporter type 1, transmembrane domain-containing protein [Mycena floridula]
MATCSLSPSWNPVFDRRAFDLNVCFEEGIILSSLYAVLFIAGVLVSLSSSVLPAKERTSKSILRVKVFALVNALVVSIVNVALILGRHKQVPVFQSYILESLSLAGAIALTYYNHTRARKSSTILLVYWPAYTLALGIWIRTVLTKDFDRLILALKCASAALGLVSFLLECIGPEVDQQRDSEKVFMENPMITANIFSICTFAWMTPLLRKGAKTFIVEDDLPSLRPEDESEHLGKRLEAALAKKHSLWKALFIAYGRTYAFAGFLKIFQDCLSFLQPQLLRWLLAYISDYQTARFGPQTSDMDRPHPLQGFTIAVIMLAAGTTQTILLNQYFQRVFETGMRTKAGMVSVIYKKALILSNDERGRATGDIVNLMSVDATRLQDFCQFGLIAISGPFQITLAFVSLYNLMGWPAFVGVAIMIFSIPLNTVIARALKKMQIQQMKNRDKRTRLMSEFLANIKSIKLYAWEFAFVRKILQVRNEQEMKMLKKIGVTQSLNNMLWSGIPLLVAFSSLAVTAITMDRPLTADIIFPAMSLFLLLQFPLAIFSQIISNIIEAIVSLQRLNEFLDADELQADARKVLSIKNADFSWSKAAIEPTLEDINLTVKKGELVGILGRVGCGKTSLLSAIIGDMTRREGELLIQGSVSYAPQNPWILSATVRENILFSHEYDETFYNLVVEACALGPDLALLPQHDLTEVGEKGGHLHAALLVRTDEIRRYHDTGFANLHRVLLDDCLAAVDSHVARHIFTNVIGSQGLLATKARILVTNSIAFIRQFDQLCFIRRGIILEFGPYDSLLANTDGEIARLIRGHGSTSSSSGSSTPFVTSGSATPHLVEVIADSPSEASFSEKMRRSSFPKAVVAKPTAPRAPESTGLSQEHKEQGQVKRRVYSEYVKAASKIGFSTFVFAILAQQLASMCANFTLKNWGEHNRTSGQNADLMKYLIIYGAFSFSATLMGGLASITMWVLCSVRSASKLHDAMLDSLIHAPLSFFELTPTGRIINLFSRDTYVVDEILGRVISNVFRTSTVTLVIVGVIATSFPVFLLFIIPMSLFYLRVMKYYLATSRELKRLDSVSRSPIFAWFSESLAGLSTIRAFNQQGLFTATNQRKVDRNQICYLSSISVNRWLAIRLEFVGATNVFIAATLSMIALITTGVDAGLVGFVLSYAMNSTASLNWVVRSASEVEQNIVSVERILHQIDVTPEAPHEIPEFKPVGLWPSRGQIEFINYSTRYRPELDLVLKNISMTINPKEKIGLLLALFRIIEASEVRSSISIVPQSPDLFEGTLRENIDPVGEHQDADIWTALGQAHLKAYVDSLPGGLDAPVREGGQSLSSGQRQLLCFARALLRKSTVLVLDEATSAVDLDTDKAIQDIIRGPAFENVTILTIAHRLNTIMESDRVLVMDTGKIAEFDSPARLLENTESIFYSLAKEARLVEVKE